MGTDPVTDFTPVMLFGRRQFGDGRIDSSWAVQQQQTNFGHRPVGRSHEFAQMPQPVGKRVSAVRCVIDQDQRRPAGAPSRAILLQPGNGFFTGQKTGVPTLILQAQSQFKRLARLANPPFANQSPPAERRRGFDKPVDSVSQV